MLECEEIPILCILQLNTHIAYFAALISYLVIELNFQMQFERNFTVLNIKCQLFKKFDKKSRNPLRSPLPCRGREGRQTSSHLQIQVKDVLAVQVANSLTDLC